MLLNSFRSCLLLFEGKCYKSVVFACACGCACWHGINQLWELIKLREVYNLSLWSLGVFITQDSRIHYSPINHNWSITIVKILIKPAIYYFTNLKGIHRPPIGKYEYKFRSSLVLSKNGKNFLTSANFFFFSKNKQCSLANTWMRIPKLSGKVMECQWNWQMFQFWPYTLQNKLKQIYT